MFGRDLENPCIVCLFEPCKSRPLYLGLPFPVTLARCIVETSLEYCSRDGKDS